MASPFSGALQLTDLDDFIGPSQVRREGDPESPAAYPALLGERGAEAAGGSGS